MNVLVCCEESQRVCIAFRDKGHNAFSCDLQKCSGGYPGWHIVGDCLDLINGYVSFYTQDGKKYSIDNRWDLIIAHPPCTYFSRVNFFNYYRNGVFNQKRFDESRKYVDLFLAIYNADCDKICIENPLPMSLFNSILPPYSMRLQPFEFGEPYSKLTCLWLKNLSYLMPTCLVLDHEPYVKINGNMSDLDIKTKSERSKFRSKTFSGIAFAMAEQWG